MGASLDHFKAYSTPSLAAQCEMQAKEALDPEYTAFMMAVADRLREAVSALRRISEMCPATCDMSTAHMMAAEADAALAALIGEGEG